MMNRADPCNVLRDGHNRCDPTLERHVGVRNLSGSSADCMS